MNSKHHKKLIVVLAVLLTLTVIVYSFPGISKSIGGFFVGGFGNQFGHQLFGFIGSITTDDDKTIVVESSFEGVNLASLTDLDDTLFHLTHKSQHSLDYSRMKEGSRYQFDILYEALNNGVISYSMLGNTHLQTINTSDSGYVKLIENSVVQALGNNETVTLWRGLIHNFKATRIEIDRPILSFISLIEQSKRTNRILELSKNETYLEIDGGGFSFTGLYLQDSHQLSGSFIIPEINGTGTIYSTSTDSFEFEIVIQNDLVENVIKEEGTENSELETDQDGTLMSQSFLAALYGNGSTITIQGSGLLTNKSTLSLSGELIGVEGVSLSGKMSLSIINKTISYRVKSFFDRIQGKQSTPEIDIPERSISRNNLRSSLFGIEN